jgi:hypothetical protein
MRQSLAAVQSHYFTQVSAGQIKIESALAFSLSSARQPQVLVSPSAIFIESGH